MTDPITATEVQKLLDRIAQIRADIGDCAGDSTHLHHTLVNAVADLNAAAPAIARAFIALSVALDEAKAAQASTRTQGRMMPDRIKSNPHYMVPVHGPLDELVVSGCDVHLEQMTESSFRMILSRGGHEMHVNFYAPGKGRVHARVDVDEGFLEIANA
jgi:hypothetical protein